MKTFFAILLAFVVAGLVATPASAQMVPSASAPGVLAPAPTSAARTQSWNSSKIDAITNVVTLYYWAGNKTQYALQALRESRAVAQNQTNVEENLLYVTKDAPKDPIVIASGSTYRKWSFPLPDLTNVGIGARVCFDLTLFYGYPGWEKYKLGKSGDPVCVVKSVAGFAFLLPIQL